MSAEAVQPGRRPFALRDPGEVHRASTWLELLFNLCFVVAISALARTLHDDPSVAGLARFAGLFLRIWWAWMGYTWFATAWDNDDTTYRIAWFGAMLGVLWLAASTAEAASGTSTMFVVAYVALRLILIGLFARVRPASSAEVLPFISRYLVGNSLGAAIWLTSLVVPEPARYAVWALGLAVEIGTPIWAVTTFRGQPYMPRIFHAGHIRESAGHGATHRGARGAGHRGRPATHDRERRGRRGDRLVHSVGQGTPRGRVRRPGPPHPNRNLRRFATSAVRTVDSTLTTRVPAGPRWPRPVIPFNRWCP